MQKNKAGAKGPTEKRKNDKKGGAPTDRKIIPIFKIPVDSTSQSRVLAKILSWKQAQHRFVATPNPEILIRALHDTKLTKVLQQADLSLPDGTGVVAAMRYLSLPICTKWGLTYFDLVFQGLKVTYWLLFDRKKVLSVSRVVPGRVIFEKVIGLATARAWKVFLLGGKPGVAEAVAAKYKRQNSKCRIEAESGPWLGENGQPVNGQQAGVEKEAIEKINKFKPDFLFVAFGPPKQEKWVARNLPRLKVGVAMVVGGAFDYLAGRVPLPPKFVEGAGFEWLWRLITQPWRATRIFTAVVIFPWKVFLWKLKCTAAS